VVTEILSTYNFSDHQCVLDVGAGKGRFISQLAQQERHLKIQLFDLAPVLQLAQVGLQAQGLSSRASFYPGSFLSDSLPTGADLITLVRVAHDHSDAVVLQILRKAFEALPLGGAVLIAEPMAQEPVQPPLADAYFHYYLLAMGSGRLRTPSELMNLMAQSGLTHMELLPNAMPIHARVLIGRKSKCLP
jgi:demethylspheroidene O-methyltransferase